MDIVEIISKKQQGLELTDEEIGYVVAGYTEGVIPDYQMTAFLMAVYFKGMTDDEATTLTLRMRDTGQVLDHTKIEGYKIDKHSTGGVGDKTTLILGPMAAALGIKFSKMSGRGLGHTGGTIDKLESIPGFRVNLSEDEFYKQVNEVGLAVVAQSGNLAPADKKIYALRDVTSTVASIPLIASSIMSKKLAANDDEIILDVKVGSGAFMKNVVEAEKLARLMVEIGRKAGKSVMAILTNMEQPLGACVGNALEVIESIETLKGNGPADLEALCCSICAYMIMDAKKVKSLEEAYNMARGTLLDGSALAKFKEFVRAQGGDIECIDKYSLFQPAQNRIPFKAERDGYLERVDALEIGLAAGALGAGRHKLGDDVDHSVGIVVYRKCGDHVKKGDTILEVFSNGVGEVQCFEHLNNAITIGKQRKITNLILKVIR
ncbi:MAG: pyrimidine-nucleoside phosphorylase [Acholeplasmatales bacterium]|nr:pyrimidine-nucleoside phosphorylase [Acholeplasmatales bacterium]